MFDFNLMHIVAGLPGLIIAMVVHEYAHALAAYKLGDITPKLQNRLTINPAAHIDPVGFIALLFVGFGWGSGLADEDAVDFQSSFLSCGLDSAPNKEAYEKRLGYMKKHTREMFRHGERIFTDFNTPKLNIKNRPVYDEGEYVIFKGLENLDGDEIPQSVIFTVNPIELTVITQINTSFRTKDAYILTPQAAGCQAIGCYVFEQAESDDPKPVLGPIDFAGRSKMKHFIPNEYLTLAMPWKLLLKLEDVLE